MRERAMDAEPLVAEFTHQAESFNASPVMRSAQTLEGLLDLVVPDPDARWLDALCGPGLTTRGLARRVAHVTGVDLTPAMVDLARREAEDLDNVDYVLGDVTALAFAESSFDGALTRFSLHHLPRPGRAVAELARVVRPDGQIVLADLVTSPDGVVAAWHQEIERLRDPSHWACLTPAHLRELAQDAGLRLEYETVEPLSLDFEEWLARGSGGPAHRTAIEHAVATAPPGNDVFQVQRPAEGHPRLVYSLWLSRWRRP